MIYTFAYLALLVSILWEIKKMLSRSLKSCSTPPPPLNKLFINRTARAVPWNTKASFFMHGPRKLGPYFKISGLVFHGTALTSG